MSCKECERLRRKLSPNEDPDFTANYLLVEPLDWLKEQTATRKNGRTKIVMVKAREVYEQAFEEEPTYTQTAIMARTLRALGWEFSKRGGDDVYTMDYKEFVNEYCTR